MLSETLLYSNETTVAVGDFVNSSTKDSQTGIYSIEVGTGTGTPTITIYGKLIQSSDDTVDSGWVELVSSASTSTNTISGGTIQMYPYMSASISGNSGAANIQVAIAYSN